MRIVLTLILYLLAACSGLAQNLVGLSSSEIRDYMKTNHSNMNYNQVVNSKFSYLKYTDNDETVTMLFFLDDKSVCRSIRSVYDLSLKEKKLKELDSLYKRNGDNKWIHIRNGITYLVTMKVEKWACTVTIEPEKTE